MSFVSTAELSEKAIDNVQHFVTTEDIGPARAFGILTVLNTTDPCVIMHLIFSATANRHQCNIFIRGANGLVAREICLEYPWTISTTRSINPVNLYNVGSETAVWKSMQYESGKYVIKLKKPLICPTGFEMKVRTGGDNGLITVDALVGYYKDV